MHSRRPYPLVFPFSKNLSIQPHLILFIGIAYSLKKNILRRGCEPSFNQLKLKKVVLDVFKVYKKNVIGGTGSEKMRKDDEGRGGVRESDLEITSFLDDPYVNNA